MQFITKFSLIIFVWIFFQNSVVFFVISCFVQMNFDPFALVILLDLDVELLQPGQILDAMDVALEGFLASTIKTSCDNSETHLAELEPPDHHNNKHDKVEQSEL